MPADAAIAIVHPMARPRLNMKIAPVRLPPDVVDKVDGLVATYGRAAFIRKAVERELKRREDWK